MPKLKGAELFAKRRKKSEKWVIDESEKTVKNVNMFHVSEKNHRINHDHVIECHNFKF